MRLAPILGLFAILALTPGALAHHCNGGDSNAGGGEFTTQSVGPSPSASILLAAIAIPFVVLAVVVAALRAASTASTGRWVYTPAAWVWVPNRK